MEQILNLEGKLVCRLDRKKGIVEIVRRGYITSILLKPDGKSEVINSKKQKER
jgi:hypothetical protein